MSPIKNSFIYLTIALIQVCSPYYSAYSYNEETESKIDVFELRKLEDEQKTALKAKLEEGKKFFFKTPTLKIYEQEFYVKEMMFMDGIPLGVSLEGNKFKFKLVPKDSMCNIELALYVGINGKDEVSYRHEPHTLLNLSKEICEAPFISERLKNGYSSVRVRLAGANYHWDTEEVEKIKKRLAEKNIRTTMVKHWAKVLLDSKKDTLSLYLLSQQKMSVLGFSILSDEKLKNIAEKQAGIQKLDRANFMFDIINPRPVVFIPIMQDNKELKLIPFKTDQVSTK